MVSLDRFLCEKLFPGVIFLDKRTIYIDGTASIKIGEGTVIEPYVRLAGEIRIGKNCRVYFGFSACNFECGDNCELGTPAQVMDVKIGDNCRIGRFAEIKRAVFGNEVNCIHHCYIGDAEVGNGVNIGAGAVTANFDGSRKHVTVIEDGGFVGVNSNLIAPIIIGHEAFIAAGSTITGSVEPNTLVKTRAIREDKPNFCQKTGKYWQRIKL